MNPLDYLPPVIPPSVRDRALPRIEGAWKKLRAMSVEKLQTLAGDADEDFAVPHRIALTYNRTGGLVGVSLKAVSCDEAEAAISGFYTDLYPFLPRENSVQLALWWVYVAHSLTILRRRHGERPFFAFDDAELSAMYSAGHVPNHDRKRFDPVEAMTAAPRWVLQLEAGREIHLRKTESNHDRLERHAARLARRDAEEVIE
jgi:hypothetical protein